MGGVIEQVWDNESRNCQKYRTVQICANAIWLYYLVKSLGVSRTFVKLVVGRSELPRYSN